MRILALETTEMIGSVAGLNDANVLAELELSRQQRTAQSLLPAVRSLLGQLGWRPDQVELVAVTIGPGSFTGLRVGVTAAKVFAYASGADVLGVDTLEAIAAGAPDHLEALSVAVDAQRGEVVAGSFRRNREGRFESTGPGRLLAADAWLGGLPAGTPVAGPVLRKLTDRLPEHITVLSPEYWAPKASTVGRLAARDYAAGRRDDIWSLVPRYSRRSAAEEKWENRNPG